MVALEGQGQEEKVLSTPTRGAEGQQSVGEAELGALVWDCRVPRLSCPSHPGEPLSARRHEAQESSKGWLP